jgi:26S proteasome regulatory subunit N1
VPNGEELKKALLILVRQITLYNLKHNAEVDACDLLIEIEQLPLLLEECFSAELDFARVCLYLIRS